LVYFSFFSRWLAFACQRFLIKYKMHDDRQRLEPQPGFQYNFLATAADIAIGGGSAGAGKSYALLLESIRNVDNKGFRAAIFRRSVVQVKNSGGLWDTSKEIYLKLRDDNGRSPTATEAPPKWRFPSGATLLFSHLENESTVFDWDGAQIALLGFDELIHFSSAQFWYMVSRNRSACGVKPYIRATTNPQTSGWVKRLIAWWLYPDDHENEALRGMPIPERAGVLRYLVRIGNAMYWGDTALEVLEMLPSERGDDYTEDDVKSVTFIPGTLKDNPELTKKDKGYKGNLMAQDEKHATRLLRGCWYDLSGETDLYEIGGLGDMFTNKFVEDREEENYLVADIAMDGSDVFRVTVWKGLTVSKHFAWTKSNGREIWETIEKLAKEYEVPGKNIVFDANGVGNFLTGFFRTSYDFRSQSTPIPVQGVKLEYTNLRAQCAYKLAELIRQSKIYDKETDPYIRDIIIEEFEAHKKVFTDLGKLGVTAKKDVKALIGRSPDFFDNYLMRMVFVISPRKRSSMLDAPIPSTNAT
jgi:hypothetical protein